MNRKKLVTVTRKDLIIDFYCASGPGGQKRNRTKSACRITHKESGAIGNCKEHKSSNQNQSKAFDRMVKTRTFQSWLKLRCAELMSNETVEDLVKESMKPENLRVEIKKDEKWILDD